MSHNAIEKTEATASVETPAVETPAVETPAVAVETPVKMNGKQKREAKRAMKATATTEETEVVTKKGIAESKKVYRETLKAKETAKLSAIQSHVTPEKIKGLSQRETGVKSLLDFCLNVDKFHSVDGLGNPTLNVRQIVQAFDFATSSNFTRELGAKTYLQIPAINRLFTVIFNITCCPVSDKFFKCDFMLRNNHKTYTDTPDAFVSLSRHRKLRDLSLVEVTIAMKNELTKIAKGQKG